MGTPSSIERRLDSSQLPSIDVPSLPELEWKATSKLKDAVFQFRKHLDKLESFWSVLDDIDQSLCISYPKLPCRAECSRGINVGSDCCIMVCICLEGPSSLSECRFMGSRDDAMRLRKAWARKNRNGIEKNLSMRTWRKLCFPLPKPLNEEIDDQQTNVGSVILIICLLQFCFPEDELGPMSGSGTDYTCKNASCSRAFHSVCLIDWLQSITTTRQSFDVLIGRCPYCSEAIAVNFHKS